MNEADKIYLELLEKFKKRKDWLHERFTDF